MNKNHSFSRMRVPIGLAVLCTSTFFLSNPISAKDYDYSVSIMQGVVNGRIIDSTNKGISGVTIKNSKGVTVFSNTEGYFKISGKVGDLLTISFIGYKTLTVPVNSMTDLSVTLELDSNSLDEVVIVGYGRQRKGNLTGAISSVNADELKNISPSNLSNTLAGRAPGVNVTNWNCNLKV